MGWDVLMKRAKARRGFFFQCRVFGVRDKIGHFRLPGAGRKTSVAAAATPAVAASTTFIKESKLRDR